MADVVGNWKFSEDLIIEDQVLEQARTTAIELGFKPISAAVGAQLAVLAASAGAKHIVEVGTGTGVSALWLLSGANQAILTSIDQEAANHDEARELLAKAGYPTNQTRLITGKPAHVLPRLNDSDYDLVVLQAKDPELSSQFEHALRLTRPGGVIAVLGVLTGGKLASPTARDAQTTEIRALIAAVAEDTNLSWAISAQGDGILQIVKR